MAIACGWFLDYCRKSRELFFQLAASTMRTRPLLLRTGPFEKLAYLPTFATLILKYRHYTTPDSKTAIKPDILGICGQ
jgi:hypothetical protein